MCINLVFKFLIDKLFHLRKHYSSKKTGSNNYKFGYRQHSYNTFAPHILRPIIKFQSKIHKSRLFFRRDISLQITKTIIHYLKGSNQEHSYKAKRFWRRWFFIKKNNFFWLQLLWCKHQELPIPETVPQHYQIMVDIKNQSVWEYLVLHVPLDKKIREITVFCVRSQTVGGNQPCFYFSPGKKGLLFEWIPVILTLNW